MTALRRGLGTTTTSIFPTSGRSISGKSTESHVKGKDGGSRVASVIVVPSNFL